MTVVWLHHSLRCLNLVHYKIKRNNHKISAYDENKERNSKRTNLARSIGSVSSYRPSHVSSEPSVSFFTLKMIERPCVLGLELKLGQFWAPFYETGIFG